MRNILRFLVLFFLVQMCFTVSYSQDAKKKTEKEFKNIIRYNISGALLFGPDKFFILGYERVVNPHQSFSINIGRIALPKFISINTDSFSLKSDSKNNGYNFSADYRFYLAKENRYHAPHGIYIGPYYALNHFERSNDWNYHHANNTEQIVGTSLRFNIHTIGAEMGYQFVFWKRLALDFVLIGPGFSHYDLQAKISNDLSQANKERLQKALTILITQKFPGMNYVFSDKELKGSGTLGTWSVGYRYLIHIGFAF